MNKQSPSVLGEIRKIEETLADQNKQIALNQNDTQYIKDTLKDMKITLGLMDNTLIRKTQVDGYVAQNEIEHKELKTMLEKVSDSTKTQWYSIAVLYGGLAVLSFLIGKGFIKI